ncbi:MAG: DNA polymerase IV [bacterium]|nr:DNA polymerase IV [bacterium]
MQSYILHIDMDAFYASVEQRERPWLRGKPVIVGNHPSGRGVVCAASYSARKFGLYAGMPLTRAKRLCPQGIFLPVRMGLYEEVSMQIMSILRQYSPLVEPISLDEAYVDLTGTERLFGPPIETAKRIKLRIKQEIKLTASVGLASNKFLAKVASELDKPDGFVVIPPEQETEILWQLPIEVIWGVGHKTEKKLRELGFDTVGSLARVSRKYLQSLLGKPGETIHKLACGIDDRKVDPSLKEYISAHRPGVRERTNPELELALPKSCGHSVTFEKDYTDCVPVYAMLLNLAEKVGYRLRKMRLVGKTVTVCIRFADFSTFAHAKTLEYETNQGYQIYSCGLELLREMGVVITSLSKSETNQPIRFKQPVRLIGISVSNLTQDNEEQLWLFDQSPFGGERGRRLYKAIDTLQEKFGERIVYRASLRYPEKTVYQWN